ncbi:hypothetical protein IGI37_000217 [Enterococcus sp. AZ194]|uniref:YveK family protein n=1 Tax=Enterococcus sp. AZ194 TaxID=2774629 RepID=UPI003F297D33
MNRTSNSVIWLVIKRYWLLLILSATLTGLVVSQLYSYITPKKYYSASQLLITPKNSDQSELKYINTYKELISGDVILSKVSEQLETEGIKLSINKIKKALTVNLDNDSQLISLQVISTSKKESIQLANSIGVIAKEEIPKILDTNIISLLEQTKETSDVTTISKKQLFVISLTVSLSIYTLLLLLKVLFGKKVYFPVQVKELLQTEYVYSINKRTFR